MKTYQMLGMILFFMTVFCREHMVLGGVRLPLHQFKLAEKRNGF